MSENQPIIYIVDDDQSVLEALSSLVRSIGLEVVCFSSANDFLSAVHNRVHGCLILDVRMPDMSGLDVQFKLANMGEKIPIVFISGHGDIPMTVKAIKNGAVDFLTKPFREEDLLGAIRTALREDTDIHENTSELDELRKRHKMLSNRELEVLSYVLLGYLNKQTAFELNISEATIKVHRHNIMKKMGVQSVAELVRMTEKIRVNDVSG